MDRLAAEGSSKCRVARVIGRSKTLFTPIAAAAAQRMDSTTKTPRSDERGERGPHDEFAKSANDKGVQEIKCVRGVSQNYGPSNQPGFRTAPFR